VVNRCTGKPDDSPISKLDGEKSLATEYIVRIGHEAEIFIRFANHSEAGASYWYKKTSLHRWRRLQSVSLFLCPAFSLPRTAFD
jgi:hypothetical protein